MKADILIMTDLLFVKQEMKYISLLIKIRTTFQLLDKILYIKTIHSRVYATISITRNLYIYW